MFDWESKTDIEKIVFFDNFYQNVNVETLNSDVLGSFLENIFKTSQNMFLKERALYYLCELSITIHITNPFKVLALLFDIKLSDEKFLIIQSIRILFLFYLQGQYVQEIQRTIAKFQNHHSAEVASESNFRLGLIELWNTQSNFNTLDILQNISNAERLFKAATIEVENRIDADFFCTLWHFNLLSIKTITKRLM
jgi:hypothetical protein